MLMKFKPIVIFCVVLLCGQIICDDESGTKPTTTVEPKTSTSDFPSTSTESTTTTTVPTTTTTTTKFSTTTTEKPSTTTEPAPSTTPKPAPYPKPTPGNWSYFDTQTNQTCVIVQMAIQLKFNYTTLDGNKMVNVTHNIPVDGSKVIEGMCNNETQMIKIETNEKCTFTLSFAKDKENFELSKMEFNIDGASINATDAKINIVYNNKTFVTPISHSYYCTKEQMIDAQESVGTSATTPAQIILSHVQLEAFHKKASHDFSAAKDCDAMETPDIVPIAVGIALAALVVVVLIAYLVARRRSQARGYMSM